MISFRKADLFQHHQKVMEQQRLEAIEKDRIDKSPLDNLPGNPEISA